MRFLKLANDGVQSLSPYQPGKPAEELQRELGLSKIIKLASNENPLGPSAKVSQAVQRALNGLSRYPDGNGFRLKQALSERLGVDAAQITLGNGSNDVLEIIPRVFADRKSEIIFSEYAFAVYPIAVKAVGARAVVTCARREDYGHDPEAMISAVTPLTKIMFIANPNNPTGTWLNKKELTALLEQVPATVIVVLDEAYKEYVREPTYPNGLDFLERYPNVIVTGTFSKVWGMAGLRLGYAISHPDIADLLNRVRQPFNVNGLAQEAALGVLEDEEYLQKSIEINDQGLMQLAQGINGLDLNFIPSVANFITFKVGGNAESVFEALLRKGVIVRPLASYQMPEHLRVSVGLKEENSFFLSTLKGVLAQEPNQKS